MKVYKVTTKSSYSGGCILIAANSKEEANNLLDEDIFDWYNKPEEVPELMTTISEPKIIFDHTYFE